MTSGQSEAHEVFSLDESSSLVMYDSSSERCDRAEWARLLELSPPEGALRTDFERADFERADFERADDARSVLARSEFELDDIADKPSIPRSLGMFSMAYCMAHEKLSRTPNE